MRKGKRRQRRVELPEGWWTRLNDICRRKWEHDGAPLDIYEFIPISKRTIDYAISDGWMTEQMFGRLARKLLYESQLDLLKALGRDQSSKLPTPVPKVVSLLTQRGNPQWADFRDFILGVSSPWSLQCRVSTSSPYFRFGFKLLAEEGRLFGDGSIKSNDASVIVHIGRNHFSRPKLGISEEDIFLTVYAGGAFFEEDDHSLFRSPPKLEVLLSLTIDRSYFANLELNGKSVFRRVVDPAICKRVVMCAWGDREEFEVEVTDLAITAA